ncbi:hypothetical protein C8R45DRAFT_1106972 [Mycena sanguinolenta]|nr:hypothetical protein C8R45DRAFT_1106972 [Mycena sanguinolenta]
MPHLQTLVSWIRRVAALAYWSVPLVLFRGSGSLFFLSRLHLTVLLFHVYALPKLPASASPVSPTPRQIRGPNYESRKLTLDCGVCVCAGVRLHVAVFYPVWLVGSRLARSRMHPSRITQECLVCTEKGIGDMPCIVHPPRMSAVRCVISISIWNDSARAALPSPQPRLEVKALRAAALNFALRSNTDSDGASPEGEAYFA